LKLLQPLRADRFKLAVHRETRLIAGHALTVEVLIVDHAELPSEN